MHDEVLALERELHEIESESEEFGLRRPKGKDDDPIILTPFQNSVNKAFVQKTIESWLVSRAAFTSVRHPSLNTNLVQVGVKAAKLVVKKLEKVQENNDKFILVLMQQLLEAERIGTEARPTPAGNRAHRDRHDPVRAARDTVKKNHIRRQMPRSRVKVVRHPTTRAPASALSLGRNVSQHRSRISQTSR